MATAFESLYYENIAYEAEPSTSVPQEHDVEDEQPIKTPTATISQEPKKEEPIKDKESEDEIQEARKIIQSLQKLEPANGNVINLGDTIKQIDLTGELSKLKEPETVKFLIDVLVNHQNTVVRDSVASALGRIGSPEVVAPLIDALKNETDAGVRASVASALGDIGSIEVVEPLLNALRNDSAPKVRRSSALAIGEIGSPEVIAPLVTIVQSDPSEKVREGAAEALGEIGSPEVVAPLITTVQTDQAASVRETAVEALGKIGTSKAIEILLAVVEQDSDAKVQNKAAEVVKPLLEATQQVDDSTIILVHISVLKDTEKYSSASQLQAAEIILKSTDPRASEFHSQASQILKEGGYITEKLKYDKNGFPDKVELQNLEGNVIMEYDYGKRGHDMWYCLDENGNFIKKNDEPVLVKPFQAKQRSEFENSYFGQWILSKTTKIYPCENCVEMTGIENCQYVW